MFHAMARVASNKKHAPYINMSQNIGRVVSSGKATLHELQTVYSVQDMHDMLDVVLIDALNNGANNGNAH